MSVTNEESDRAQRYMRPLLGLPIELYALIHNAVARTPDERDARIMVEAFAEMYKKGTKLEFLEAEIEKLPCPQHNDTFAAKGECTCCKCFPEACAPCDCIRRYL